MGGSALVTNEVEGFTKARSAERGRVGEGVTPPADEGPGVSPRIFGKYASKWCILKVTHFTTENLYEKKKCENIHIDHSDFFMPPA